MTKYPTMGALWAGIGVGEWEGTCISGYLLVSSRRTPFVRGEYKELLRQRNMRKPREQLTRPQKLILPPQFPRRRFSVCGMLNVLRFYSKLARRMRVGRTCLQK